MKIILIILLSTITLLFFSCTQDMPNVPKQEEPNGLSVLFYSNPFDNYGQMHNLMLEVCDSLMSIDVELGVWDNVIYPDQEFHELVNSYIATAGNITNIFPNITETDINDILNNSGVSNYSYDFWIAQDIESEWISIHNNVLSQYSALDSSYTAKILDIFRIAINEYKGDSTFIMDELNNLQSEMLSIQWNSQDSLAFICLSIAKHSLDYWSNNFYKLVDDTTSTIMKYRNHKTYSEDKNDKTLGKKKKKLVKPDNKQTAAIGVAATALGDVIGAALGSVAGPAGTVAGAVGGSVEGAGIAGTVIQVVDWVCTLFDWW